MIDKLQQGWEQAGWRNWLLLPLSLIYSELMKLRHWLYKARILRSHSLPVPVIVVGNLTVGGTGKSPLVVALVKYLHQQGFRPGIISRGYGGHSSFWPRIVVAEDGAEEVGDEPLMLFQLTGVPVVVGPDRVLSGQMLMDKMGCDIIVSDDGFQHLALERDIDVVVIDGDKEFGNGLCLPSGPLRESKAAMSRANLVVINGETPSSIFSDFAMNIVPSNLRPLRDNEDDAAISQFTGNRVGTTYAIAGLGNPQRFFNALEQMGVHFVAKPFDDHHKFVAGDFGFLKAGDSVIMTAKDAVKCKLLANNWPGGVEGWVLPVSAHLDPAFFSAISEKIRAINSTKYR